MLGQGARLTLTGLAAGLLLGVALARSLAGLLFGVQPTDVLTFAAVLAVLGLVSGISIWLPSGERPAWIRSRQSGTTDPHDKGEPGSLPLALPPGGHGKRCLVERGDGDGGDGRRPRA